MKIIWAGQSCFQIIISNPRNHSTSIVIDPFDKTIGLKEPRFSADILLVTHDHPDHNNVKAIRGSPAQVSSKFGRVNLFLIKGAGEYEIKGVFIKGIPSFHDDVQGKERGENTIYTIEIEGMKLCHFGDIGQKQLTDEQLEKIGSVDILMVPIGGICTISSQEAQKIISQIEPKIVIPMHYQLPKLKIKLKDLSEFLKVMGRNSIEPQASFSIKSNSLLKEGMEIVILRP